MQRPTEKWIFMKTMIYVSLRTCLVTFAAEYCPHLAHLYLIFAQMFYIF
jgi:hypothetical protein